MQWDSSKMKKPKSLTDFMKCTQKSKASSPKCQKYADDLSAERECIELCQFIVTRHQQYLKTNCAACGKFFCGGCASEECVNVVPKSYLGMTDPAARATPVPVCVTCYSDIAHKP